MLPGIYKMLDSGRNIIYVGKSKCLRKRVQTYFVSNPKWEKVNRMISLIKDVEYVVTDTHLEARLLECKLIKEIRPYFNAQMKNDKKYFFIRVENYNRHNPLSLSDERGENCFGPFRSRYTIGDFLNRLRNIYPITKNGGRYEFEYHIFPEVMEAETFALNRELLLELFTEEDNILMLIEALQAKLEEAAASFRYEIASVYRDMITCFRMLRNGLYGYKALASKNILLKIPFNKGHKLFFVSGGNIINSIITDELTKAAVDGFIADSISKDRIFSTLWESEKARIDFRDVMYSEISDMPEEMVEFLS